MKSKSKVLSSCDNCYVIRKIRYGIRDCVRDISSTHRNSRLLQVELQRHRLSHEDVGVVTRQEDPLQLFELPLREVRSGTPPLRLVALGICLREEREREIHTMNIPMSSYFACPRCSVARTHRWATWALPNREGAGPCRRRHRLHFRCPATPATCLATSVSRRRGSRTLQVTSTPTG